MNANVKMMLFKFQMLNLQRNPRPMTHSTSTIHVLIIQL